MTLKAHFDGQQIVLDEPCDLPPNTPLIVTVLAATAEDRAAWSNLSKQALARAYSDSEPEYGVADLKTE